MESKNVIINSPLGIHLRPAGAVCDTAIKFKSEITLQCKNKTANAKSVLSVLAAGVKCGDEVLIRCEGSDEKEALDSVTKALTEAMEE